MPSHHLLSHNITSLSLPHLCFFRFSVSDAISHRADILVIARHKYFLFTGYADSALSYNPLSSLLLLLIFEGLFVYLFIYVYVLYMFYLCIYFLKGRVTHTHIQTQNILFDGLSLKFLQHFGVGQSEARARTSIRVSHMDGRNPSTCAVIFCLPSHMTRKLDHKRNGVMNQHYDVGYQVCKQRFNLMLYNTSL